MVQTISDRRHIQTVIVTTMSRSPQAGSTKSGNNLEIDIEVFWGFFSVKDLNLFHRVEPSEIFSRVAKPRLKILPMVFTR